MEARIQHYQDSTSSKEFNIIELQKESRIVQKEFEFEVNIAMQVQESIDKISNIRFEVRRLLRNHLHNLHHLHPPLVNILIILLAFFAMSFNIFILADDVATLHTLFNHIAKFSE